MAEQVRSHAGFVEDLRWVLSTHTRGLTTTQALGDPTTSVGLWSPELTHIHTYPTPDIHTYLKNKINIGKQKINIEK